MTSGQSVKNPPCTTDAPSQIGRRTLLAAAVGGFVCATPRARLLAAPAEKRNPAGAPAQNFGSLEALLARFAKSPGLSASFSEEKHISLLKTPLTNSGRVYFKRPNQFARHITAPFPSSVLVDEKQVTLWDGAKQQILPLPKHPALAQLTTTFLFLLAGDLPALRRAYDLAFSESDAGWSVTLAPKSNALKQLLTSLTVKGRGLRLEHMTMLEASGDRSETRFSDLNASRRFTPAEVARYFAIPPP